MRVVVTGAAGQVGTELVAECRRRPELELVALTHAELDVADRERVRRTLAEVRPELVLHPAAFTAVDACETDPERAFAVNALGTRNLAEAARHVGAHLAYVSTDYVFDGTLMRPYHEWDAPNPLSVYGASKLAGERELDPGATIARASWVCGRVGQNMAKTVLRLMRASSAPLRFVEDQRGSPTFAADFAPRFVELALERRPGVYHLTNAGSTTWYGFARAVLELAGEDPARVEPITTAELEPPRPAPRPANSVLDNAALRLLGAEPLPFWRDSLGRLVAELLASS